MISPQGYKLPAPEGKHPFFGGGEDESVNRIYANATVDEETGIPGVVVTKTINGRDITFNFQFHNLKGETGEQGPTGKTGATGQPGQDGFSPEIIATPIPEGYHLRIIDETGEQEITIADGKDGAEGFSPTAKVEQTESGATITVTDKEGTTTATIANGAQGGTGPAGVGVPTGGTVGQVLGKIGEGDYETAWIDQTGGGGIMGKIETVAYEGTGKPETPYVEKVNYVSSGEQIIDISESTGISVGTPENPYFQYVSTSVSAAISIAAGDLVNREVLMYTENMQNGSSQITNREKVNLASITITDTDTTSDPYTFSDFTLDNFFVRQTSSGFAIEDITISGKAKNSVNDYVFTYRNTKSHAINLSLESAGYDIFKIVQG